MEDMAKALFQIPVRGKCFPEYRSHPRFQQKAQDEVYIAKHGMDGRLCKNMLSTQPRVIPADFGEHILSGIIFNETTGGGNKNSGSMLLVDVNGFSETFPDPFSAVAFDACVVS